jgi:peptidoglycan/xylan/chitin deacetylase (PgdA/CDA1 family)
VVERELDAFLAREGIQLKGSDYLLNSLAQFVDHPLLWYGNHSHHHYVLSSLTREEQYEEISTTQSLLASLPIRRISNVFSIPFGQRHHFNREGQAVLRDLGFKAALLNRGRVNGLLPLTYDGIEIIDRFTPEFTSIEWPLRREFLRTQLHRLGRAS